MTNKIGYALAVGITYPMLDWIGFVPGGTNTTEMIEALKYIFIFTPIPIVLLAAPIMWLKISVLKVRKFFRLRLVQFEERQTNLGWLNRRLR